MFNKAKIEIYEIESNDIIVTSVEYPGDEGIGIGGQYEDVTIAKN